MRKKLAAVLAAALVIAGGAAVARELTSSTATAATAVTCSTPIGYQDGIAAYFAWYRKQPGVPQRGPGYDPNVMSTWTWVDKLERTFRIWKDDHDAACAIAPPPTTTTTTSPPPTTTAPAPLVAPRTYNKVLPNGSDARFCMAGLPRNAEGRPFDAYSTYDVDGRSLGGRSPDTQVPGLPLANNMNGADPCEYIPPLAGIPPWPSQSYDR